MPCQHEYGEEVDCLLMEGLDPATGRKVWRCWAHKPVPPPRTASDTRNIIKAQTDEIAMMKSWLRSAGQPASGTSSMRM